MIGLLYERLTMAADVPHDGDCLRAIFLFKGSYGQKLVTA